MNDWLVDYEFTLLGAPCAQDVWFKFYCFLLETSFLLFSFLTSQGFFVLTRSVNCRTHSLWKLATDGLSGATQYLISEATRWNFLFMSATEKVSFLIIYTDFLKPLWLPGMGCVTPAAPLIRSLIPSTVLEDTHPAPAGVGEVADFQIRQREDTLCPGPHVITPTTKDTSEQRERWCQTLWEKWQTLFLSVSRCPRIPTYYPTHSKTQPYRVSQVPMIP